MRHVVDQMTTIAHSFQMSFDAALHTRLILALAHIAVGVEMRNCERDGVTRIAGRVALPSLASPIVPGWPKADRTVERRRWMSSCSDDNST